MMAMHPVAAVLSSSQRPFAYMLMNESSVLKHEDSDSSVSFTSISASTIIAAILLSAPTTAAVTADTAPFHVPHLFWKCSISGPSGSFPLTFEALIDHGSHAVLIREELINTLCLRC